MRNIKIIGIIAGLFFLIGSGVVVGLTVVRIQNEKATVDQPRAQDSQCNSQPSCCGQIASGGGFDKCGWPDRGWCTLSQCDGSDSSKTYDCNRNGGPRNCNCGLFVRNYCQSTTPPPSGGNGASFTATYPTGGVTVDSLKPTFTWTANTTGLNYNCLNVHTDQCQTPIPALSRCPGLSDRSWTETTALSPNTTYYWVIYGQPGWPAPGTGCQSFKTGAATPPPPPPQQFFGCVNKTCAVVSGATANANGCTAVGGTCCASNSDCSSDQTCAGGTCSTTGEVGSCWGNEGSNGRCYDCNGDGAINILDFSCFAKTWLQNL
ncbi:hypothetical protein HY440_01760 [Candidatus Microgenomates bacterium]|nr:hypothetical protein [Candidatus Microgenomates bacterium]